jgi:hypothetical protein
MNSRATLCALLAATLASSTEGKIVCPRRHYLTQDHSAEKKPYHIADEQTFALNVIWASLYGTPQHVRHTSHVTDPDSATIYTTVSHYDDRMMTVDIGSGLRHIQISGEDPIHYDLTVRQTEHGYRIHFSTRNCVKDFTLPQVYNSGIEELFKISKNQ